MVSLFSQGKRSTAFLITGIIFKLLNINGEFIRPCFNEEEIVNVCRPDTNSSCHDNEMANFKLIKLDGVKIGHVQNMELEYGRLHTIITRAMKPTIFEIPNFLSNEECDYIISLAKQSGLEQSVAGFIKDTYDGELDMEINAIDDTKPAEGPDELLAERFDTWDKNGDSQIDFTEIEQFAFEYDKLYLKKEDVQDMLKRIGFSRYEEGIIKVEEFEIYGVKKILAYLHFLKDKHPLHRHRLSEQTWLYRNRSDPVLRQLIDRITRLTKLPSKFIISSEAIQVVQYKENGHYHGHFDSNPTADTLYCCHQNVLKREECTLCRFITILYYLNDVDEGGETAFPIADQHLDHRTQKSNTSKPFDELNLSEHCKNASLILSPKKGTAVMWYNYHIDPQTGYLGNLDQHSLHGGCVIKKGSKWIANNWISAPTSVTAHIKSIYGDD